MHTPCKDSPLGGGKDVGKWGLGLKRQGGRLEAYGQQQSKTVTCNLLRFWLNLAVCGMIGLPDGLGEWSVGTCGSGWVGGGGMLLIVSDFQHYLPKNGTKPAVFGGALARRPRVRHAPGIFFDPCPTGDPLVGAPSAVQLFGHLAVLEPHTL